MNRRDNSGVRGQKRPQQTAARNDCTGNGGVSSTGSLSGGEATRGAVRFVVGVGGSAVPSRFLHRNIPALSGHRLTCPCEHMFYARRDHPPRRPRRVLRVGRATRRPPAARPAGDRRRRCGAGGELRGKGRGGSHGDGRPCGAATVPGRDRRRAADVRLYAGQPGRLRGVPARPRRLVEGLSIDEAFLDVGGLRRIAGPPSEIATRPARARSATRSACRSRSAWRAPSSWPRSRAGSPSPTACWWCRPTGSSRSCIRCRSSGCGASGR